MFAFFNVCNVLLSFNIYLLQVSRPTYKQAFGVPVENIGLQGQQKQYMCVVR